MSGVWFSIMDLNDQERALFELGRALKAASYQFVTVTPETHRRVLERNPLARDLRDVFGWNRWFEPSVVPDVLRAMSEKAGVFVETENGLLQSSVRFSSLDEHLLVHSAFPTAAADSVFFGPDTYRFCSFVKRCGLARGRVVDVGTGTGAGGIVASRLAKHVVLSDINGSALQFARVNAAISGITVEVVESDVLAGVSGRVDTVIANPPYMRDGAQRLYRDGGGAHGEGLSLRIAEESVARLAPGGRLLLYTGAPVISGCDILRDALRTICQRGGASFSYEELDPDVFGEQLDEPGYECVERIAAVGLVATLP